MTGPKKIVPPKRGKQPPRSNQSGGQNAAGPQPSLTENETALNKEASERAAAAGERTERAFATAEKLDKKANRVRERALQREKIEKNSEAKVRVEAIEAAAVRDKAAQAAQDRIALEPPVVRGPKDEATDPVERLEDQVVALERVVLTVCSTILEMGLTPAQRGKMAACLQHIRGEEAASD